MQLALALLVSTVIGVGARQDSSVRLPPPTGPHPVGTTSVVWVDSTRVDSLTGPPRPREVVVQLWYPAAPTTGGSDAVYAPFLRDSGDYGRTMARVRSNARADAPLVRGKARLPLVVFATGRATAAYDYSALMEELASRGYVVAGVNSPGQSRVLLPNGAVLAPFPGWAPSRDVLEHFDRADVFFESMNATVSDDLRFVLGRLRRLDAARWPIARRIDFARVGMMGHSNGAMAGARACARTTECRAYLGIEGTQPREIRKGGTSKPYALLISEQSLSFDRENVYRELLGAAPGHYVVMRVAGAGHNSVTDLLVTRPGLFRYDMPAERGIELGRAVVVGFFDRHLGGRAPTKDAEMRARFPELTIERD